MKSETVHTGREALLLALIERLERRGYADMKVSALEGYEGRRPAIIFWEDTDIGFVPDVSAARDGLRFIFQVETAQSLQGEDARQRIALFCAYAAYYRSPYCLVVPEEARDEAGLAVRLAGGDERFVHVASF